MSDTPRLFCLDTVLVDVVLQVAALPAHAGDALAHGQMVTTGGGFNAMSAAARHGMRVLYAGRLGSGPFAALATADLERELIGMPLARNDDVDSGICVVLLEPDGERSFVTSPGAEATLRRADLELLDVNDGDVVLVSGYNVMYPGYDEVVLEWLADLAPSVVVVFDPATRMVDIPKANLDAVMNRATWLLANATEGSMLSERGDALQSATVLASRNDRLNVLIRNGAKGCVVALNHSVAMNVAGFATTVVDTNGAGDVHNGVFIAELASGHDALAAARWANAAAAMSISRYGPASCPPRAEVAAWIAGRDAEALGVL